uniref:Uncharacterized protein n=1 Tax=Anguilla anguilla TaxID=7936 RepID=A0A0E9S939_ANGAN
MNTAPFSYTKRWDAILDIPIVFVKCFQKVPRLHRAKHNLLI